MVKNSLSPRLAFDAYVPANYQKELLRTVFRAAKDATREVVEADYQHEEALDLYPFVERARREQYLRVLTARFPSITTESRENRTHSGHHTFLQIGSVVLTSSAVKDELDLPRWAAFRTEYARPQMQFEISDQDDFIPDNTPPAFVYTYAILVTGGTKANRRVPGFARIVFPNSDCTGFIDDGIDLMVRYPGVINEFSDTEVVVDTALPSLVQPVDALTESADDESLDESSP